MQNDKISRHEFLRKMGLGGSALMAVYCAGSLSSCVNETVAPGGVTTLTINLDDTANKALKTKGGFIIKDEVVIALTNLGTYVAVTIVCTHEGNKAITYQTSEFVCSVHGARYDNTGKGLNTEGKNGIKVYPTSLNGNILTVTVS